VASIEVRSLRKEFDVPEGKEIAVDSIDFSVGNVEFLTLVGPSGCGKTTTLRCIAGLEQPTSGSVSFDGTDLTTVPPNKRNLAMMFQNIALYPHMTVRENSAYPLKVRGIKTDARYEQAREAAEIMQVSELLDKYPGDVSGGQKQRVALARTITQDPIAFLMDEPLSDLDAKLKVEIRKEVQKVQKRLKKPTIYVTHDQEEAMTMSDRIAVMNDGRIEQIGTPDDLYERPNNVFVASFIGTPPINLIDGTISRAQEGSLAVDIRDETLEFDVRYTDRKTASKVGSTDVIVGIRPEHLKITEGNGDFTVTIQLLERTGDNRLATLAWDDKELQSTLPADTSFSEGEEVSITLDRSRLFVFDKESETLLARS
jgi:multiple sugar transport system ATP-binding protein